MIAKIYSTYTKSTGVSTDTRTVKKGNLFFALSGANFNGNQFTKQALEKGAIACIIDDERYSTEHTILVDDVLKTLQQLAKHHRQQLNIPIIALTGSNGKTTTKELIHAVLSTKFNTTATIGNLNNHIGVPLTLLNMNADTELGIVEMGANHPKEIQFLCNIACPNYGYITNFGKAHLEGFGSLEGVIKAKSELYDYLKQNNQMAFVNIGDKKQVTQAFNIKQYTFSQTQNCDTQIVLKQTNPKVILQYNTLAINSNMIGSYNFTNIAAAINIGNYFQVSDSKIKEAIEAYNPTNNRSQIIVKNGHEIILDAYNANPTSMLAALQNLNHENKKHKTIFLGDMFELGDSSDIEHQNIVNLISEFKNTTIYILGQHFKNTKHCDHIKSFVDFTHFKNEFKNNIKPNSVILIKGSRGMALERILDFI